jgi:hypothetical protein
MPTAPIKRTNLERFDVPQGDYETVIMLVEVPPQVNSGLHIQDLTPPT